MYGRPRLAERSQPCVGEAVLASADAVEASSAAFWLLVRSSTQVRRTPRIESSPKTHLQLSHCPTNDPIGTPRTSEIDQLDTMMPMALARCRYGIWSPTKAYAVGTKTPVARPASARPAKNTPGPAADAHSKVPKMNAVIPIARPTRLDTLSPSGA